MKLTVLGSSSAGNCYLLDNGKEALVIEAGVSFTEVKKAVRFHIARIKACVVSHRHNDHAGFLRQYSKFGVNILASVDVLENTIPIKEQINCKMIESGKGYKAGNFLIFPFDVRHDVPCMGFIIEHPEMGKIVFVTDTMMVTSKFPKINHYLIEANYSDRILEENILAGLVPAAMRARLLGSHMELETTKGILKANDLTDTRNIVLVHLSSNNSDQDLFKSEIESLTGIPTYIATKKLSIELI